MPNGFVLFVYRRLVRTGPADRRTSHRHVGRTARAGHAQLQVRWSAATGSSVVPGRTSRGRGQQRPEGFVAGRVVVVSGGVAGQARLGLRYVLVHRSQRVRRGRQQKSQLGRHM